VNPGAVDDQVGQDLLPVYNHAPDPLILDNQPFGPGFVMDAGPLRGPGQEQLHQGAALHG